jgi:hypothetical protein
MTRFLTLSALALLCLPQVLGCGPANAGEACGLPGAIPTDSDLANGQVRALRDGAEFTASNATWSVGPSAALNAGELTIIIVNDETGSNTESLIGQGAFPLCIDLGERSGSSGNAQLVGTGFVSDAAHTGSLSILGNDGGMLSGRFEVTLADGSATTRFSEGAFRVPQFQNP